MPAVAVSVSAPPKKRRNQYSSKDQWNPLPVRMAKAKVLIDSGATYDEVRAQTGLCLETISRIKHGEIKVLEPMVEALKRVEGHKLTLLTHTILDSIDDRTIKKASLLQRVVGAATLIDKRELLEGRATSRVSFDVSDTELDAQIAKAQAELVAWRSGKLVNADAVPCPCPADTQPTTECNPPVGSVPTHE